MSKFVVDLNESKTIETPEQTGARNGAAATANVQTPQKRGRFKKALKIFGIALFSILLASAVGGYFYWRHLKRMPQYSLALLVDAARRDDKKTIDELIDTDAIIDDFMPQVTGKAVELYGRNVPPATIAKIEQVAAPLLPAVKIRARAEIPGLIRDKMQKLDNVPFWAIALGAGRYVEITQENDKAFVGSKLQEQSEINLTMKRSENSGSIRWQVVGVKDEELAKQVAEKIGQQIILAAGKGGIKKAGEQFGVQNLGDVLKQFDGVFK